MIDWIIFVEYSVAFQCDTIYSTKIIQSIIKNEL